MDQKNKDLFIENLKKQKEDLIKNPITSEEFLLAHKECPTCVPFFKVLDIFYKELRPQSEHHEAELLTPWLFSLMFLNRTLIEEFLPLVKAQFNHLAWLHQ